MSGGGGGVNIGVALILKTNFDPVFYHFQYAEEEKATLSYTTLNECTIIYKAWKNSNPSGSSDSPDIV